MDNTKRHGEPAKTCITCKLFKGLNDFYNDSQTKDRKASRCKECAKQAVRASRQANIERVKEYDRKRAQATRDAKKQRLERELNTDFLN